MDSNYDEFESKEINPKNNFLLKEWAVEERNRFGNGLREFGKKLHPDAFRRRLRNFRKFLLSVFNEKRSQANTGGSVVQNSNYKEERSEACHRETTSSPALSPALAIEEEEEEEDDECNKLASDKNGVVFESNRRLRRQLATNDIDNNNKKKQISVDISKHESDAPTVGYRINETEMDAVLVPNVIVQEKVAVSPVTNSLYPLSNKVIEPSLATPVQLVASVEAPPVRNKSPVTVQEWINSLPLTPTYTSREECDNSVTNISTTDMESDALTLGAEAGHVYRRKASTTTTTTTPVNVTIISCGEPSEAESHCSSVDSLLEARKPDPEEILLSLGFGGTASSSYLETGRVPKRFLNPSQLRGVDIEEFIRQQQDLIYTFESGFYGYRGLAGSSHSSPSVIVAKILERLREHEKESISMSSCHPDFRKRCSVDQNAVVNQSKKFSKVAKNILTKIRCTPPSGSVLSPDNRRWLESQGNKSPEIARRLIIGQQSFTFGRDGDLIESFEVGNCNRNENENGPKCNGHEVTQDREKKVERNSLHTETSADSSSNSALSKDKQTKEQVLDFRETESAHIYVDGELNNNLSGDLDTEDLENNKLNVISNAEFPSLQEEIACSRDVNQNPVWRMKNVLTRCTSFEESVDENSGDELAFRHESIHKNHKPNLGSQNVEERSYSSASSELCDREDSVNKELLVVEQEYEDLQALKSVLEPSTSAHQCLIKEHFLSLTIEQRIALQLNLIRRALGVYLNQLHQDDINPELKNCLISEVQKVTDLLDGYCDSSKLSITVRQITLLLQQQNRLSTQIKELSFLEKKPSSCQVMRDRIMNCVHELELLVQRNAQELAHMKNQLGN